MIVGIIAYLKRATKIEDCIDVTIKNEPLYKDKI